MAYQDKKAICLDAHATTKPAEYPSSCYANQPNIPELVRDVAVTNIVGFVLTTLAVVATMVAMGILGVRMLPRDSGPRPETTD
jgi:hypothetical protein